MKFQDVERLSTYLDGQLSPAETARLEARLASDSALRQVLDDLRVARGLSRMLPRRRAPRRFTLNPLSARVRAPQPLAVAVFRFAGAVASLLFVFAAAVNSLAPLAARSLAAAQPPGYGMGGGGGDGTLEAEAPAEAMAAPVGPTLAVEAPLAQQESAAPTQEAFSKEALPAEPQAADTRQAAPASIPPIWLLLLGILGILLVGLSWYTDRRTRRNFRSKLLEK